MSRREERVNAWVAKWKHRLLLDAWGVTIRFRDQNKEPSAAPEDPKTVADTTTVPLYTDAKVNIYPAYFKEPISGQEQVIVHELCHIITDPIHDALMKAVRRGVITEKAKTELVEGLTEHLSKTLFKAYKRKSAPDKSHYHI